MTITPVRAEIAEQVEAAEEVRKDAEAAYFASLSQIVDLRTLQGGRHGYDFEVEASAAQLHELTQRIVDLEYDINDKLGVHFRTYVVAV